MSSKKEDRGKGLVPSGRYLAQSRNSYQQRAELLRAILVSPFDCSRLEMLKCAKSVHVHPRLPPLQTMTYPNPRNLPEVSVADLILRPGTKPTPSAHCNHRAPVYNVVPRQQSSTLIYLSRFHPSTTQHQRHPLLPRQFPARRPQRIRSQRTSA